MIESNGRRERANPARAGRRTLGGRIGLAVAVTAGVALVLLASRPTAAPGGTGLDPGTTGGILLRDLSWDLEMGHAKSLPAHVDLEWTGSQGNGDFYRQTHLGVPVWGSYVVHHPVSPHSPEPWVTYRLYDTEKLIDLEEDMRGPAVSPAQAMATAEAALPGGTYEAELVVYPQPNLPLLVWAVEQTDPEVAEHFGSVVFVDARDGSEQAILRPERLSPVPVPAPGASQGSAPLQLVAPAAGPSAPPPPAAVAPPLPDLECPSPSQAFRHAYGEGVGGERWCLPVKVTPRSTMSFICFTELIANEGGADELHTHRWDSEGLEIVGGFVPGNQVTDPGCVESYYDDFEATRPLAVNVHRFLWEANAAFNALVARLGQSPVYPIQSSPRPARIHAEIIVKGFCPPDELICPSGALWYGVDGDRFRVVEGEYVPDHVAALGSQRDIVFHEYAHAVIAARSGRPNLRRSPEARAMLEAVADVLGMFAETRVTGGPIDWRSGEGAGRGASAGLPLRDLSSPHTANGNWPGLFGFSRENLVEYQSNSRHQSATILGHGLYLLVEGGSPALSVVFPAPEVQGIGQERTEEILYMTLPHLVPGTDHCSFGERLVESARQLYASTPALAASTEASIRAALRAVGIVDHVEIEPDRPVPVSLGAGESAFFKLPNGSGVVPGVTPVTVELSVPDPEIEATLRVRASAYPSPTETCAGCQSEVHTEEGRATGALLLPWTAPYLRLGSASCGRATDPHTLDVYVEVEAGAAALPQGTTLTAAIATPETLDLGEPIPGLSVPGGNRLIRHIRVPPPKAGEPLVVTIQGGGGDADLYLARDRVPVIETGDYDLRATGPGTRHFIRELSPAAGDYYLLVDAPGAAGFEGAELLATLGEPAPKVTRNQDDYHLCDLAVMRLETFPPQPNQPVFGWRRHNGAVERDGDELDERTDGGGRLVREIVITDPQVCGLYQDEQFAVGSVDAARSQPLTYAVDCQPIQPCPE